MYKESGLDIETMIDSLFDHYNEIVPIIGEEVLYYKGAYSEGQEITLRNYLLVRFQKDFPEVRLGDDMMSSILNHGYYGLSLMRRMFNAKGKNYIDRYKKYMNEAEDNKEIFMKPYIKDFLVAFQFPLIVTTICFRSIENILNDNGMSYNTITYNLNGDNRNPLPLGKNIYHIFGTARESYNWVYDERKLLDFMHSLHEKDFMADNLVKQIKNADKRIMVLGCNMPDWIFRFLWYPIYSDYKVEGEQGYWINDMDVEDSFDNFLQDVNYASNDEVKVILERITAKIKELNSVNMERKSKKDKFDVFISYASENYELVKVIYKILSDMNIDAWFDENGDGRIMEGENYMKKIEDNVPKCRHYMPIVTEAFINKSLSAESNLSKETYIINEHYKTLSPDLKEKYSLPVIVLNQKFNGNDVDTRLVESFASLGILKTHFYFQKKMISFDANAQETFRNLDWGNIITKQIQP